jgi:hypothetical protein
MKENECLKFKEMKLIESKLRYFNKKNLLCLKNIIYYVQN